MPALTTGWRSRVFLLVLLYRLFLCFFGGFCYTLSIKACISYVLCNVDLRVIHKIGDFEMINSDDKAMDFLVIFVLLTFILPLVVCYIESVIERWKQEDRELFFRSCQTLSDEQKRRADPVRPVRSESEYDKYSCKGRIELLEEAHASGDDIPQSGIHIDDK